MNYKNFSIIPNWMLFDEEFSLNEISIFAFMFNGWAYSKKNRKAYQISMSEISKGVKCGQRTVVRTIEKFREKGILSVKKSVSENGIKGMNIYEFDENKLFGGSVMDGTRGSVTGGTTGEIIQTIENEEDKGIFEGEYRCVMDGTRGSVTGGTYKYTNYRNTKINTCNSSNTREEQPTEKEIEKLMGELEGGCEETGRSSIMSEVNRKFTEDVNKIKTLTGRIKFLTTYEELERSCSSAEKYFESLSSSGKYHSEKQKRLARQLSDKYNEAFNRKAESLQRYTSVQMSNKPQCEHFTLEDYNKLPELNL